MTVIRMAEDRLEQLKVLLAEQPSSPFIHFALAIEFQKRGNENEALTHFRLVVEHDAGYVGVYYHLAALYRDRGNVEQARKTYLKGIALSKQAGDAHTGAELQAALDSLA